MEVYQGLRLAEALRGWQKAGSVFVRWSPPFLEELPMPCEAHRTRRPIRAASRTFAPKSTQVSRPLLLDAPPFEEPTTERGECDVPYAGSKRPEHHAQPTIAAPGPKFTANHEAPHEVPDETLPGSRRHPAILARLSFGRVQGLRQQMQAQRLPSLRARSARFGSPVATARSGRRPRARVGGGHPKEIIGVLKTATNQPRQTRRIRRTRNPRKRDCRTG
jgi:hypothetical protein